MSGLGRDGRVSGDVTDKDAEVRRPFGCSPHLFSQVVLQEVGLGDSEDGRLPLPLQEKGLETSG